MHIVYFKPVPGFVDTQFELWTNVIAENGFL